MFDGKNKEQHLHYCNNSSISNNNSSSNSNNNSSTISIWIPCFPDNKSVRLKLNSFFWTPIRFAPAPNSFIEELLANRWSEMRDSNLLAATNLSNVRFRKRWKSFRQSVSYEPWSLGSLISCFTPCADTITQLGNNLAEFFKQLFSFFGFFESEKKLGLFIRKWIRKRIVWHPRKNSLCKLFITSK